VLFHVPASWARGPKSKPFIIVSESACASVELASKIAGITSLFIKDSNISFVFLLFSASELILKMGGDDGQSYFMVYVYFCEGGFVFCS
jgi:hypothetical protein